MTYDTKKAPTEKNKNEKEEARKGVSHKKNQRGKKKKTNTKKET